MATAPLSARNRLAIRPVPRSCDSRISSARRAITFVVGGENFAMQKPFLALQSPTWKHRLQAEPDLDQVQLEGTAQSFQAFANFFQGSEGTDGEVTMENVFDLLHWSKELDIGYIPALCEEMLFLRPPEGISPEQLLALASRHDMPLLYTRATENVAHNIGSIEVPDDLNAAEHPFATREIREDIVRAHISMGLMRNDGESHRRQRFADYGGLNDAQHRARLLWKSRHRFQQPQPEPDPVDWRKLQTCWPHHSLRGDDWLVVPAETQPRIPLQMGAVAAASFGSGSARRGESGRRTTTSRRSAVGAAVVAGNGSR